MGQVTHEVSVEVFQMLEKLNRIDRLKLSLCDMFGVRDISIDLNELKNFITGKDDMELTLEINNCLVTFDYDEEKEEFTFNFNAGH